MSLFEFFALFAALVILALGNDATLMVYQIKPANTFACDGAFCHINQALHVGK